MRSYHMIILLLLATGIAAAGYASNWRKPFLNHTATEPTASMPPPGNDEPSKSIEKTQDTQSISSTRSTGDATTVAAARAQFTEAKVCADQANKLRVLDLKRQQCASVPGGVATPDECKSLPNETNMADKALNDSQCTKDPVRIQETLTRATATAARAGDADAQLCFIDGGYFPTDKADINAYGAEASSYINSRLAAGDWRVVQTLATPPESLLHRGSSLIGQVNIGLPFTAYRATRLLQYGSDGSYFKFLDAKAKALSRNLTPAQVANADEWAKEEFNRHFSNSVKLDSAPSTCLTE